MYCVKHMPSSHLMMRTTIICILQGERRGFRKSKQLAPGQVFFLLGPEFLTMILHLMNRFHFSDRGEWPKAGPWGSWFKTQLTTPSIHHTVQVNEQFSLSSSKYFVPTNSKYIVCLFFSTAPILDYF